MVSAYRFLKYFPINMDPKGTGNVPVTVINASTVSLTTGLETTKTVSTDQDLKPVTTVFNQNTSTCSCSNLLKEAELFFILNPNQTIGNLTAKLKFYDIIPSSQCGETLKIKQSFSVKFLTQSPETYYEKSGNPGYIFQKPLLTGYMSSEFVNGQAIWMPRVFFFIFLGF